MPIIDQIQYVKDSFSDSDNSQIFEDYILVLFVDKSNIENKRLSVMLKLCLVCY